MNIIRQTANFSDWLSGLRDLEGKGLILARIDNARLGNFGDCEPVGDGVSEMRLHFGPGYRIYLMREDLIVYLLLCGGNKSSQRADIMKAKAMATLVRQAAKSQVAEEKRKREITRPGKKTSRKGRP